MSTQPASLGKVDYAALRTNQAFIIVLLVAGFLLDQPWFVGLTGLMMFIGTAVRQPGFVWLYHPLRRIGLLRPDVVDDNREPHLFSQGFGALFNLASFGLLLAGAATAGWVLAWVVIVLAGLNLFGGFCVGCAMYYWFSRWGLPGFRKLPETGAIPGRRPSKVS